MERKNLPHRWLVSFGLEGENYDFQKQLLVLYVFKVLENKRFNNFCKWPLCLFHIKANIMLNLMKAPSNSWASNLIFKFSRFISFLAISK